jgi:hypothetical protein
VIFTSKVCFVWAWKGKTQPNVFEYRVFRDVWNQGEDRNRRKEKIDVEELHNAYSSSNIVKVPISKRMR